MGAIDEVITTHLTALAVEDIALRLPVDGGSAWTFPTDRGEGGSSDRGSNGSPSGTTCGNRWSLAEGDGPTPRREVGGTAGPPPDPAGSEGATSPEGVRTRTSRDIHAGAARRRSVVEWNERPAVRDQHHRLGLRLLAFARHARRVRRHPGERQPDRVWSIREQSQNGAGGDVPFDHVSVNEGGVARRGAGGDSVLPLERGKLLIVPAIDLGATAL